MLEKNIKKQHLIFPLALIITGFVGVGIVYLCQHHFSISDHTVAEKYNEWKLLRYGQIRFGNQSSLYSYEQFYDEIGEATRFKVLRGTRVVYEFKSSAALQLKHSGVDLHFGRDQMRLAPQQKNLLAFDLSGSGSPYLVLSENGGGIVDLSDWHVINLSSDKFTARKIENIPASGTLKDVNRDGRFELVSYDGMLARGEGGRTGYPAYKVVLEFKSGKFVYSPNFNRESVNPYSVRRAERLADRLVNGEDVSLDFFSILFDMIYRGQGKRALQILDKTQSSKNALQILEEFDYLVTTASQGKYWSGIERINGWNTPAGEALLKKYLTGC